MAIEEGKKLKTITIKELLEYLITHEYIFERDPKENVDNKKKKDLGLQLWIGGLDGPIQAFYSEISKNL